MALPNSTSQLKPLQFHALFKLGEHGVNRVYNRPIIMEKQKKFWSDPRSLRVKLSVRKIHPYSGLEVLANFQWFNSDECRGWIIYHHDGVTFRADPVRVQSNECGEISMKFTDFTYEGTINMIELYLELPDFPTPMKKEVGNEEKAEKVINGSTKKSQLQPLGKDLRDDEGTFDFALISRKDGSKHGCHKSVLAVSSQYFSSKFHNDSQDERNSSEYFDVTGPTIDFILDVLYFREINLNRQTNDDIFEILAMAKMLLVEVLVETCEAKIITDYLTKETAMELLRISLKYNFSQMRTESLKMIAENPEASEKLKDLNDISLVSNLVKIQQLEK